MTNAVSGLPLTALNNVASPKLTAPGWYGAMTASIGGTRQVAGQVAAGIAARATALRSQATSDLLVTSAATLLLLSLVVLVSTVVARSLVRPLRKLRLDALDVASHRLPEIVRRLSESEGAGDGVEIEPIGVTSTDEIGEVARAFDQVHQEAVRLAAHEAMLRGNLNAMFVNLSRRSQALVERQLGIIDALEQSEQDSDRLSSLFRLDHLATRMRRNSENLLVLAGHEDARKWSQPVSLVDAIRAAISEIEQYERIVVNIQPGVLITGRAATDVVRLTAELVENAATFSPDSTQVLVTGQQLASGGVLIEVTDRGLGIADQELEYANWRLDNPPVIDVDVSRRMGLFVVGRLAARHGIRVRLRRIQPCGLSALVWLPETVAEPETVTAIVPAPTAARRTVASDWFIGEATAARLPRRTPNGNRLAEFQRGGCPGHRRMPPVRPEQRLLAGRGCGLRGWRPARHAHRQRIDVPAHLPGGGHLGLQVGPAWHRGQLRRHRLGQGPRPPGRGHSWLRRLRHPDPARRAGRIKAWDDPAIEADNPAATLPATAITLAVRSDSSGTTNNFTNFLVRAAGSAWTLGSGSTITWPAGSVAGRSNSGVAQIVKSTPGAIGYVDYATAKASGLTFASVMNKDGHFVAPSPASAAAAAGQATPAANGTFSAIWAGGALSYPITYQSFDLVYAKQPNANDAKMLRAYLGYLLGAGQELLPQLGYAPLPSSIDQQAQAQLSKIGV